MIQTFKSIYICGLLFCVFSSRLLSYLTGVSISHGGIQFFLCMLLKRQPIFYRSGLHISPGDDVDALSGLCLVHTRSPTLPSALSSGDAEMQITYEVKDLFVVVFCSGWSKGQILLELPFVFRILLVCIEKYILNGSLHFGTRMMPFLQRPYF